MQLTAMALAISAPWGVSSGQIVRAQEAAADEGISVLGRGPVHEAFADPALEQPAPSPVVPKQPPESVEEIPPPQRPEGENVEWIPGYWWWDEDLEDFIWVSGVWRDIPPGWQWVPGYWRAVEGGAQRIAGYWVQAGQTELEYLPPPPPSIESGPSVAAPGDDYFYVPGCFIYQQTRYAWRPGYWMRHYAGWCWSPARYVWTPLGCLFIDGHWDLALERRGLLFAPVHFRHGLWAQPGWRFRPRHLVLESALVGALFVNPSRGCYFFGDYFDRRYSRRGFIPWVDFRIGRRVADPLFVQHRREHRDPDRWERNVRAIYDERLRDESARPPRDLARQEALGRRGQDDARRLLARLDERRDRLTDVPQRELDQTVERIRERRTAIEERRQTEVRDRTGPPQVNERPRVVERKPSRVEGRQPPRRTQPPETPKSPLEQPGKVKPKAGPEPPRKGVPKVEPGRPKTTEPVPRTKEPRPKESQPRPKVERPEPPPKTNEPVAPRPKVEPRPKLEPRPELPKSPRAEPRPQTPKTPRVEPRPQTPKSPRAEPRPELPQKPRAEKPRAEKPRAETPRAEPRLEPRPQPKAEPREFRPTPRPEPRPQVRPSPQVQPRPEPRIQPRSQPRVEPRAQPRAEPPRQPPRSSRPQGRESSKGKDRSRDRD
jgi:hypothetical protein